MTSPTHKISVRGVVVMGDSLSDRGTAARRKIAGVLPMKVLSGLSKKSPRGRFTNGFLWGDYLAATIAEDFQIAALRKKLHLPHTANANADLSDQYISNANNSMSKNEKSFSLNNDMHVLYQGRRFARFYCEGGLTDHHWAWDFTFNLVQWFTRLIMSTLDAKRTLLENDDEKYHVSAQEKAETLVIEWSGANDLITVNTKPTYDEVEKAIVARIKNLEQLIKDGYRNIVLFNLPDLSLTPRYQRRSKEEQQNAHDCSVYFNKLLNEKSQELLAKYQHVPGIHVKTFDVFKLLTEVYNDPAEYGFDKTKLTTPFTETEQFKKEFSDPEDEKKHITPAEGYMFWDDVHPTADMHAWLAEKCKEECRETFEFKAPRKAKHTKTLEDHFTSDTSKTKIQALPQELKAQLKQLYAHAQTMHQSKNRARREKGQIIEELVLQIQLQKGDLNKIRHVIDQFLSNPQHSRVLKAHDRKLSGFFMTTHTEDSISALQKMVQAHVNTSAPAA